MCVASKGGSPLIYVLFIVLLFLSLINFFISKFNVLYPSVVVCSVFTLSSFVYLLNYSSWNVPLDSSTCCFIVSALTLFSVSTVIGGSFKLSEYITARCLCRYRYKDLMSFEVSKKTVHMMCFICICTVISYFRHQYLLSLSLGNTAGIAGMIHSIRSVVQSDADAFRLSHLLNVGLVFTRASGFISLFLIINNYINKDRSSIGLYLIQLCFVLTLILSTGRGGFIVLFTSIIYDVYILHRLKNDSNINIKIIKFSIIGIFLFFVIFRLLGYLSGNSKILSLWDAISIYAGSSILCLNDLLVNGWHSAAYWGQNTFRGLFNILRMFGGNFASVSNHAEMAYWGNYGSNVYTSFYTYLLDFDIYGVLFLQLVLGLLSGFYWGKYTDKNKCSLFLLIVYGRFWGYTFVYYSIAERFFSELWALNTFVEIFFYILIIKFLFNKQNFVTKGNDFIR